MDNNKTWCQINVQVAWLIKKKLKLSWINWGYSNIRTTFWFSPTTRRGSPYHYSRKSKGEKLNTRKANFLREWQEVEVLKLGVHYLISKYKETIDFKDYMKTYDAKWYWEFRYLKEGETISIIYSNDKFNISLKSS